MKKCTACHEEKDLSMFHTRNASPDGLAYKCKPCCKLFQQSPVARAGQKRYRESAEGVATRKRHNQTDKWKATQKRYKSSEKGKISGKKTRVKRVENGKHQESQRNWERNNKAKRYAMNAKRRAALLQATPPWLTKEHFDKIEMFYRLAQKWKSRFGEDFDVDHLEPLQGEEVSGLHVPWNLEVKLASENRSKGNRRI